MRHIKLVITRKVIPTTAVSMFVTHTDYGNFVQMILNYYDHNQAKPTLEPRA